MLKMMSSTWKSASDAGESGATLLIFTGTGHLQKIFRSLFPDYINNVINGDRFCCRSPSFGEHDDLVDDRLDSTCVVRVQAGMVNGR